MASQLQIINLAFAHLSEPTVESLSADPPSPSVVKALAQWPMAVETALARAPWLCCLRRETLTRDDAAGDHRYAYRFTLPAETLKVWSVEGGWREGSAWQAGVIVGQGGAVRRVIYANAASLDVELCVTRPPEALTPLLADALAWEMASRLAGPIQSSEAKGEWARKRAAEAYLAAAGAEASEIGGQDELIGMGPIAAARLSTY